MRKKEKIMTEAKNIDDVLIKSMQPSQSPPVQQENQVQSEPVINEVKKDNIIPESIKKDEDISENKELPPEKSEIKEKPEKPNDTNIDEYGNPIEKSKMYSEDEVQRMIRERLSRGRNNEQPIQQHLSQPQVNDQPSNSEDGDWKAELEQVIDETFEKRQIKFAEQQWRENENIIQQQFESKFSAGMNKYSDFNDVVYGKPITDTMMLSTRSLDNPAAFVYSACKLYPKEIERISKIKDIYSQASEVGRLHERMIKSKSIASGAPKPIDISSSDLPPKKTTNEKSIDERINEYGRNKRK
jgi:hypothetical protein